MLYEVITPTKMPRLAAGIITCIVVYTFDAPKAYDAFLYALGTLDIAFSEITIIVGSIV